MHRSTSRRSAGVTLLVVSALASAAGALTASPTLAAAAPAAGSPGTTSVTGPFIVTTGVTALGPQTYWASGYQTVKAGSRAQPEIARCHVKVAHGVTCHGRPVPVGLLPAQFSSISNAGASNVWAVGSQTQGAVQVPLAARYDGSRWRTVQAPSPPGAAASSFTSVSAASPTDVWAVGIETFAKGTSRGFVEHYNGKAWTIPVTKGWTHLPLTLTSVDATNPHSVWACGSDSAGVVGEHYNGTVWSSLANHTPPGSSATCAAIAPVSGGIAWEVGQIGGGNPGALAIRTSAHAHQNFVLAKRQTYPTLTGVAAPGSAPDQAWAVGSYLEKDTPEPLLEHWDGKTWTALTNVGLGPFVDLAFGSAKVGVAVGNIIAPKYELPYVVVFQDGTWQVAPMSHISVDGG